MKLLLSRPVSCLVVAAVVAVSCLVSVCGEPHYPDVYDLEDFCDENNTVSLAVDKSIIIKKLGNFWEVNGEKECFVNLKPTTGDRLVANFTSYKMDLVAGSDFGDDCDYVALFLAGETGSLLPSQGYCKTYRPRDQFDLGKNGSFGYKISSRFTFISPGVQLLVTEVTDKKNEACPEEFFDCDRRNYCIDDSLTCNTYNDCGNDDDEIEGCGLTNSTTIHLHPVQIYYLQDRCDETITVDKSIIVKSIDFWTLHEEECFVNLKPSTGDRLVANFTSYKMDLVGAASIFDDDCDSVALFLAGETGSLLPSQGYCHVYKPEDQFDLGTNGTIGYKIFSSIVKYPRVELLVTEVTDKINEACPDGFFDCDYKNYCIDDSLTCNMYNDCGNNDDEIEVCDFTNVTTTIIG